MPQYKKVFDVGTYTGNGGMYRVGIPTLRSVGPSGKQAAGSLRFRDVGGNDAKLSRTFAAGNQLKWTWSCWMKFGEQPDTTMIFNYNSGGGYNRSYHQFTNYQIHFSDYSTSYIWQLKTTQVFKDPSIWYHIVVIYDSAQATASNRVIMYSNGSRITSYSTASYPSQNYAGYVNQAGSHVIGSIGYSTAYSYDGYMSEMYFLDGYAYDASYFGEYNSDNIWVPKAYSGAYGTTGFYLPMNSSSNYATDQSGNGNNWTPNNMNVVTSNTTYDLMTDSPTDYGTDTGTGGQVRGNYCTWDTVTKGSTITLSNGNLGYTVGGGTGLVCPGTITVSSGKWYWEITVTSATQGIGVAKVPYTASMSYVGIDTTSWGWYSTLGKVYNNTFTAAYGTYTTNDVIGVALDADAGSITFYKNGVSFGAAFTGMTGPYVPIISVNAAATGFANFGQRAFAYTAPSGHKAICSTNITRPLDSALWFNGDSPDLIWIKNRSTTGYHTLTDTVRGMGLNLITMSTNAETSYPAVTEMNKFGMTLINDATTIVNGSTNSHVYWGWKANGSTTVTNTSGSITSQVSANPATGFSIVTYTASGVASTVGHGLSAAPHFIIQKARHAGSGYNWAVYHKNLTSAAYFLRLNTTDAQISSSAVWGTAPTSSVFSIGTDAVINDGTTGRHVAYCWTSIPGYSDFGSYTGNGAADGVFVYTGFRPKWLFFKRFDTTGNWFTLDVVRNTYNVMDKELYLDQYNAEFTFTDLDILSNGFKFRTTGGDRNGNTNTFIYGAFAEIPFKFSRAR